MDINTYYLYNNSINLSFNLNLAVTYSEIEEKPRVRKAFTLASRRAQFKLQRSESVPLSCASA